MTADASSKDYWSLDVDTAMENMNLNKLKVKVIHDEVIVYESDYVDGKFIIEIQQEGEE